MKRDDEIDALASLEGDRGRSVLGDVKKRTVPGAKLLGLIVGGLVLALVCVLAYKRLASDAQAETRASSAVDTGIRNQMPELRRTETPPPPPTVPELKPKVEPIKPVAKPQTAANGQPVKSPTQLLRERRLSSQLADGGMRRTAAAHVTTDDDDMGHYMVPTGGPQAGAQATPSMADRLSPVRLSAAAAGHIGSMDLLLLQSAMIDCVLNTRIDSTTQPGMMSCDATRDVYSSNGRTVLLDRGTRFTGHYERGITRGQPRIFVVWERAVTPQGVVINLDSPGTDPLGGAGLPGEVNHHFWRRFGAAILISAFEDAGDYAVARANRGSGTYIGNTTRAASDSAPIVLQHSINIPPTLTKRHGDRVSIFVARDLDFNGIYDLSRRH